MRKESKTHDQARKIDKESKRCIVMEHIKMAETWWLKSKVNYHKESL